MSKENKTPETMVEKNQPTVGDTPESTTPKNQPTVDETPKPANIPVKGLGGRYYTKAVKGGRYGADSK